MTFMVIQCRNAQNTLRDTTSKNVRKKKYKIYYKELAKPVYLYPAEILCATVPVSQDQLFLTAQGYQFLSDSI